MRKKFSLDKLFPYWMYVYIVHREVYIEIYVQLIIKIL